MGLLDLIKQETRIHVDSMLPPLAQDEIMNGRLPILRTSLIFLKSERPLEGLLRKPWLEGQSVLLEEW